MSVASYASNMSGTLEAAALAGIGQHAAAGCQNVPAVEERIVGTSLKFRRALARLELQPNMSEVGELRPPLEEFEELAGSGVPGAARTLAEAERGHILEALRAAGWVVGGPGGAASRLGLSRTTLIYRMRKLGIARGQLASASC